MKKFLYITHLSGKRVNRLWISALTAALAQGYEVHLACNKSQIEEPGWPEDCRKMGIIDHHIDFNRDPLNRENKKAYKELLQLMQKEQFDIVHCNTPIGGMLGRICAHKVGTPYVIYQAHGFHFWDGAPLKNWMFYYPFEKWMARYTDTLITINKEDYNRSLKFKTKKYGHKIYVHGVGVIVEDFQNPENSKEAVREKLGINSDAFVFVTTGELIHRKNQATAIKAFVNANIPNAYLLICGSGELFETLNNLINNLGCKEHVKLLGFRQDMVDVLNASNAFVFPSFQEGLPVAQMEAMSAGLPCIVSKIRGNTDLLGEDYPYYFDPNDINGLSIKMKKIVTDTYNWRKYSIEHIKNFSFDKVVSEFSKIYNKQFDD